MVGYDTALPAMFEQVSLRFSRASLKAPLTNHVGAKRETALSVTWIELNGTCSTLAG